MITWLDVVKLTVPFLFSIILIWIKGWYDRWSDRNSKQRVLSRLLLDELQTLPRAIEELGEISDASGRGKLRLVSFDIPSLVSGYSRDLAALDAGNSYIYSNLSSFFEIANKGVERLSTLTLDRAKAGDKESIERLNDAIKGQCRITAKDFITYGKAARGTLDVIPEKNKSIDKQTLDDLDRRIRDGEAKANSLA